MKIFASIVLALVAFTIGILGITAGPLAALAFTVVATAVLTPWNRPQALGQLNLTTFNDKLYADEILQQVVDMLAPLRAFSTDFSPVTKNPGDTVTVGLFGAITTTTFTQATDVMEQTGGLVSAVTITLNSRKITPVDLTTQQLADSSNAGKMDAFAYQMAQSAASMVLTDIMSAFTVANFGAPTTTASANFKLDAITAIRVALNAKLCPKMNRSLIIDDGVESGILSDTNLVLALNRGNGGTINEGDLGRILGFDVITMTNFPLNAVSLIGVACGKGAMAVAFRGLDSLLPDGEFEAKEVITDPATGLSFLYTRHWSRAQAKWFLNMQALYGYTKAVTKQAHLVCTATA